MPLHLNKVRSTVEQILIKSSIKKLPVEKRLPINLRLVAESLRLEYAETQYNDETEARLIQRRANRFIVIINTRLPAADCRFTLAHQIYRYAFELGLYELKDRVRLSTPADLRKLPPRQRKSKERADRFATELLVPSFLLEEYFNLRGSSLDIAYRFQVSRDVADYAISLRK